MAARSSRIDQPGSLTVALFAYPELVTRSTAHFVDVNEREGMTRGYSLVDERPVREADPTTEVVEEIGPNYSQNSSTP